MKTHYLPAKQYRSTFCGTTRYQACAVRGTARINDMACSGDWSKVTCARCLKRKPDEETVRDKVPLTTQMEADIELVKATVMRDSAIGVFGKRVPAIRLAFARLVDAARHSDRVLTILARADAKKQAQTAAPEPEEEPDGPSCPPNGWCAGEGGTASCVIHGDAP